MTQDHAAEPLHFAAIDFETANVDRNSACAIGLTVVRDGHIVARQSRLIRPPSRHFEFTHIHQLTWEHVRTAPEFGEVWEELRTTWNGVGFLAAHNAGFDRGVLRACCEDHGVDPPRMPWVCTVNVARKTFGIRPTTLSNVCHHLGIPLNHHEAGSDAEACARIVLTAARQGWRRSAGKGPSKRKTTSGTGVRGEHPPGTAPTARTADIPENPAARLPGDP